MISNKSNFHSHINTYLIVQALTNRMDLTNQKNHGVFMVHYQDQWERQSYWRIRKKWWIQRSWRRDKSWFDQKLHPNWPRFEALMIFLFQVNYKMCLEAAQGPDPFLKWKGSHFSSETKNEYKEWIIWAEIDFILN